MTDRPSPPESPVPALAWLRRHPYVADGALALALLWFFVAAAGWWSPTVMWLMVVQLVPLTLRRVAPFPVALVVAVGCLMQLWLYHGQLPSNLAVLIVVYTVASYAEARWQSYAVLGMGGVGAMLAAVAWSTGPTPSFRALPIDIMLQFVVLAMAVGAAWALGDVLRRRREVLARLREQNEALARDQAQRSRLAAQDERASIAREMHDIVAHSLSVVVVQADGGAYAARAALERGAGGDWAGVDQAGVDRDALHRAATTLETVARTARAALADTRRLVGVLRDDAAVAEYAPQQGLGHLDELVGRLTEAGVPVRLAVRGEIGDLTAEVDLAAYRVVQESLTNVLKHAGPGASAEVDVLRSPAVLLVRVSDDGRGPHGHDGQGNGIIGMTERVEVLGGTLYAGRRAGGGFEAVASIPVARAAETERTR